MTAPIADNALMQAAEDIGTEVERFIRGEVAPPLETPVDEDAPQDAAETLEQRRAALMALYGDSFPLSKPELDRVTSEDWARWASDLWDRHAASKRKRLHLNERNRLYRKGVQWISSANQERWREPPKPRDAARVVDNVIGPALDQRVQLIAEQRPGFRTRPVTQDPDDLRRSEAQQIALEYQYDQQNMVMVLRETAYWNGTDGVAFWLVWWDPDAGPWHEEQPSEGQEAGAHYPMGDVQTRVIRMDQLVVSANATSTSKPTYYVLREKIPLSHAVAVHGAAVADSQPSKDVSGVAASVFAGDASNDDDMLTDQDSVVRYMVFCEPTEFLPAGLLVVIVGSKVVFVSDLPIGMVPIVRVPDGSPDPAYFPRPLMDDWVDHQTRINVILSRWVDSIRLNSGGRFFARPKALSHETLVGGLHSFIEVRGQGPIQESVQAVPNFSVGEDTRELLDREYAAFQAKSGWSKESRGQFGGEASGRAILAARESLERVFAEPIGAAARAMTDWAKISLGYMKWGYDLPRTLGVMGQGRPDLAREITKDDLDGASDVEIDAETLMPMPRALRMFLLDQYLEKGLISPQEYRRRSAFSYLRDIQTPDEDQFARARRVAEAIRQLAPPPEMRWQDNEAIHQDVLEREIILRDDLDPRIVMGAQQRWMQLAQQASMKQQGMFPPPPAPPQGAPAPAGEPGAFAPSPHTQPLLLNNPGVAAAPEAMASGFTGEQTGEQFFDSSRPS